MIMVVDDEADMRFMVRKVLENEGYEVIEAENGKTALEKLKETKPDLLLLDVMMPGLDGWEVCKRIRENEDTKDIIVTMLTVKSSDEDKVTSFDEGLADWHISKPFKKQRFVRTVKWLLESPLQRE
ncbi:MAG: PleD family two-component system response regulator [Candidatus Hydrothermarchaeales archaeon]